MSADHLAYLSEEEIAARRAAWTPPPLRATSGILRKYAMTVATASQGCVTDQLPDSMLHPTSP